MQKKYIVRLTDAERALLTEVVKKLKGSAQKVRRARIEVLREETRAWHEDTNNKQRGVDWQFRIDNARTKLKSLYPKIKG